MSNYVVVWRKEGSLSSVAVSAEDPKSAWEKFLGLKLGGGIPVSGTLAPDGGCTKVVNAAGKSLAAIIPAKEG